MKDQNEDFADQLGRYLVRVGFKQQELANKIGMHRNTIVKWMNRTSYPTSRGQVLRVADELSLLKEERKALIQAAGFSLERWPTEIWTVPQQRDMFFTGRDNVFQSLLQEQAQNPKDLDIAALLFVLSILLGVQGKYTEAEPLYQRALSIQETMLGYNHPTTVQTRQLSAIMLRLVGMQNEIIPLEAQVEQAKKKTDAQ